MTTLRGHNEPIVEMAFNPQDGSLTTSSRNHVLITYNVKSKSVKQSWPIVFGSNQENHDLTGLQFGGLGNRLLTTSSKTPWSTASGALVVWEARTGKYVRVNSKVSHSFSSTAIQKNGPLVAAGSSNGVIRFWDTRRIVWDKPKKGKNPKAHMLELQSSLALPSAITAMEFHPNSKSGVLIAGCGKGGLRHLQVSKRGGVTLSADRFPIRTNGVRDISISPDGDDVAVADRDSTVHIYSLSNGKRTKSFQVEHTRAYTVQYDPSGEVLAIGYEDGEVRFWKVVSKKELFSLSTNTSKKIRSIAFSTDGKYVAVGGDDTAVRVWRF